MFTSKLVFALYHYLFSKYIESFFESSINASWFYSGVSTLIMLLGYAYLGIPYQAFTTLNYWQMLLLDYNIGYFIADAYRIWYYAWDSSSLYFYHHLMPILYSLVFPRFGLHYFQLFP